MDTLTFICVIFATLIIGIVGLMWAVAWERKNAAMVEAAQKMQELQTDAVKTQVEGQLQLVREEAIREAARRGDQT